PTRACPGLHPWSPASTLGPRREPESVLTAWRRLGAHPQDDFGRRCPGQPRAEWGTERSRRWLPAHAETGGSAPWSAGRGYSIPNYSSRKFLPVSWTNTSSSEAE